MKVASNKSSHVYLIHAFGTDMFKIGIATDSFKRIKTLQTGSPVELQLIRNVKCKYPSMLENELHTGIFNKYHSHGEWFKIPKEECVALFDKHTIPYQL